MADAFEAKSTQMKLGDRVRFETLISDLSARFIRLPADSVDRAISEAIEVVREFFNCDRCGLLKLSEDGKSLFVTHVSYAEGVGHLSGSINLVDIWPWVYRRVFIEGRPHIMVRPEDLPAEAERDRQTYMAMGVRSGLSIPLFVSETIRYIIGIQSLREECDWPLEYVPRLRLLGEVFVNALARRDADAAVLESERRLRLATEAAEIGLWGMDMDSRVVWGTDWTRHLYHIGARDKLSYQSFLDAIHPDDRQRYSETLEHALVSGGDLSVEYRVGTPGGKVRWIAARGRCECSASGRPASLTGIYADITERKQAEAILRDFSGHLIEAAESERAHLAREIHDDFNQRLSLMAVELDMLAQSLPQSPDVMRQKVGELSSVAKDLSADMQRLSRQLHPAKLAQLGLVASLRSLCKEASLGSSTRVAFCAGDVPRVLPESISLCLYRIAQEALRNVVRHSGSREARVEISAEPRGLCLTITDTGSGFAMISDGATRGLGLTSMRERARLVHGELTVDSEPGLGTRVVARIPN